MNGEQRFREAPTGSDTRGSLAAADNPVNHKTAFSAASFASGIMHHSGIISLFDQALVSATNFLTGMIIGRFCGKDEFGLYMLGMTIILVITDLQTSLITTPYMIFTPQMDTTGRATYHGSSLVHQTALVILAGIMLFGAGIILRAGFGPPGLGTVLLTLSFFGIFLLFRNYVRRILFARLRMKRALLFDAFVSVTQLAGLGTLAYLGLLSAARTYMVIGSVAFIAVGIWLLASRGEIAISADRAMSDAARNWTFGKWVFASGLLWTASMNMYPWFITAFHGTSRTGVWAACMGIMALGNPLLLGIQNYLGPRIATVCAHNPPSVLHRYVYRSSALFAALLAPVLLVLVFFGGRLLVIVYGATYAGNGAVVAFLGVNLFLSSVIFSFSRALFALERADLDFKINFSALAVLFGLGIWLVKAYGPLGAAIGLVTANAVSSLIRWAVFTRLVSPSARTES